MVGVLEDRAVGEVGGGGGGRDLAGVQEGGGFSLWFGEGWHVGGRRDGGLLIQSMKKIKIKAFIPQ